MKNDGPNPKRTNTDPVEDSLNLPAWINLVEACKIKGLNYQTAQNKRHLQPRGGVPDGRIGGRKAWKRKTIATWMGLSDEEIGGAS